MFTARATEYIESLPLRSHIVDDALVGRALEDAGVPVTQRLLDYHNALAGRVIVDGYDEHMLGLIHPEPRFQDRLAVEAFHVGPEPIMGFEEPGNWYVSRADAHPDYEMLIDPDGKLYSNPDNLEPSSFELHFEQYALISAFVDQQPTSFVPLNFFNGNDYLVETLLPRLAKYRSDALSDECTDFYTSQDFIFLWQASWCRLWYPANSVPEPFGDTRLSDDTTDPHEQVS